MYIKKNRNTSNAHASLLLIRYYCDYYYLGLKTVIGIVVLRYEISGPVWNGLLYRNIPENWNTKKPWYRDVDVQIGYRDIRTQYISIQKKSSTLLSFTMFILCFWAHLLIRFLDFRWVRFPVKLSSDTEYL